MKQASIPNALLLIATHCPHCHALETLLRERMTNGFLGELEVINVDKSPEEALQYGIRSVPWLQLGNFVFDEALTPAALDRWIEHASEGTGQNRYIVYLLERGRLAKAIEWLENGNMTLKAIIPVLADPEAKINIRVGIGAILEHFEDTQAIRDVIPDLIALLAEDNQSIRTDACHYLSLTHSSDAIEPLKKMLDDVDPQVREVARESLEVLMEE